MNDARYGRVIILADADDDGAHIRCLLLTFFYRYMKPFLNAVEDLTSPNPPLYKVEAAGGGKKKKKVQYAYSDEEMQGLVAEFGRKLHDSEIQGSWRNESWPIVGHNSQSRNQNNFAGDRRRCCKCGETTPRSDGKQRRDSPGVDNGERRVW